MALKKFVRNFKPLEILTEEQVETIYAGILEILWKTGIVFDHKGALQLLEKHGCRVSYEQRKVCIPSELVEESLRKCPASFVIKARNPEYDVQVGGNQLIFMTYPGRMSVDLDNWDLQRATRKEYYEAVTVLDALESLHTLCAYTPWFEMEGVPPAMAMPESLAARLRNSTKVPMVGSLLECDIFHLQMAEAVGTEIIQIANTASPLTINEDVIDMIFRLSDSDFVLVVGDGGNLGATAPATIAGAAVTGCAQMMAAMVLAKLVRPGARIIASNGMLPLNMRSGHPRFGDVSTSLHTIACNQIWRKFGVPTFLLQSCSSKKIDFQLGYERMFMVLANALSGTDLIGIHGTVSSEISHHPVQAILDDDMAHMIGRFLEGVNVSDGTLALELIREVGPVPGNYLGSEHTREWWRKEQFIPKAADILTYDEWIDNDKKDCLDYAKDRMAGLVAAHKADPPLTAKQEEDVERVLKEAREHYRNKGHITGHEWEAYMKSITSPGYPFG